MIERGDAERLDAADPLAPFRERFVLGDPETLYLDGNSLGRLPLATRQALHERIDQWGAQLVAGWHEWIDIPQRAGDVLAEAVLGARPGEVIVADSTTVNLYKLASAVLTRREGAIITDRGNFPTDRYVLEGLARRHGRELILFDADPLTGPQAADIAHASAGRHVALVSLSHVAYRSGALADVEYMTQQAPAPLIWDLSHSAGAVSIELDDWGVELAVGCTYKYLNAGPGAPAFMYVRADLQALLRQPIWGWFGQRDQFAMGREYDPVDSIDRYLVGTPPVLGLYGTLSGVRITAEAGIDAIAAKARELTDFMIDLYDEWLVPLGFALASPRDGRRRGAHVTLHHPQAWQVCQALKTERVIPDFRTPDRLRLGVAPLYTSFADVCEGMARLRAIVGEGRHLAFPEERSRVT